MKISYTKRLFLMLFALLMSVQVFSAYIKNVPQIIKQPNGATVHLYATGDEFWHWLHDESGFTVVQNPKTGFFCYAKVENDELIATEWVVGTANPSQFGLTPNLNISSRKIENIRNSRIEEEKRIVFKTSRGKLKSPDFVNSSGVLNNLVVYIRFSDESEWNPDQLKYTNYFDSETEKSMKGYFKEVSYGVLDMNTSFFPTNDGTNIISFQDSHPRAYYQKFNASANPIGYTDANRNDREFDLLVNASKFIASQVPASLNIDNDNDGYVDNVCFIIKGDVNGWGDLLWPHRWSMGKEVKINNKIVSTFNFQLETFVQVGVLCHEMFHSLGSPDLYHYSQDRLTPVGPWDLMENTANTPQHMTQYMKWRYGKWISSIPEITSSGDYTLNPVVNSTNNCYKIKSLFSSTDYFVIEYRKKIGFETDLPSEGLLVYRINTLVDGNGNRNGPPDEVYVYRPGALNGGVGTINNATFNATYNRTIINDNTDPAGSLSNNGVSGLSISNVSAAGQNISFHVDILQSLALDAGITKLLSPVSSALLSSNEHLKVHVTNIGNTKINGGFKVKYNINNGKWVEEIFSAELKAHTTEQYVFKEIANLSVPGTYNIKVLTDVPGDLNKYNDTLKVKIINPIPLDYTVTNTSSSIGSYTDLTTGTIIPIVNGDSDDGSSAPTVFPTGFKFKYCGTTWEKFILNTNGFIKFGENQPSKNSLYFDSPQGISGGIFNSQSDNDNLIISPFGHDLMDGQGGAEYRVDVQGTAPYRICTIQFKNLKDNDKSSDFPSQFSSINFQIKLYETTNIIEFVYGNWIASGEQSNYRFSVVGLRGLGNLTDQLLSVSKGSTNAWSDVAYSNSNYSGTATFNFGNLNGAPRPLPPVGFTLRFRPISGVNLKIADIISPVNSCEPTNFEQVKIKIKNTTGDIVTNFPVYYKLNLNNPVSEIFKGQLGPYEGAVYTFSQRADLTKLNENTIEVGVLATNDQTAGDNTMTKLVKKVVPLNLPFAESFEGVFPPQDWSIVNPDNSTTWERHALSGISGNTGTAYINSYDYKSVGANDELITPLINLSSKPELSFQIGYAPIIGNPVLDTIKVFVVTNCGMILQPRPLFNKGGEDLKSIEGVSFKFIPSKPEDFRTFKIDLSEYAGQSVRIKFVSVNQYGNDISLDNIAIKNVTDAAPVADFTVSKTKCDVLEAITFKDLSEGIPTSWEWSFGGNATPSTSTEQNPIVTFNAAGKYDVTLKVTNSKGENSITKSQYLSVGNPMISEILPHSDNYGTPLGPNPSNLFQLTSCLIDPIDIDLDTDAEISRFEFKSFKSTTLAGPVTGNIKIYLQNTTDLTYSNPTDWETAKAGMTLVYSGPITVPVEGGFFGVDLTTKFKYTGKSIYWAFEWVNKDLQSLIMFDGNASNYGVTASSASNSSMPISLDLMPYTYRPVVRLSTEAKKYNTAVREIYSLSKVVKGNKHTVSAYVYNNGWAAIQGKAVNLKVEGANSFTSSKTVDLDAFTGKTVEFDENTYENLGTNTITVSVEGDELNTNNQKVMTQEVTDNLISVSSDVPERYIGYNSYENFWNGVYTKYHIEGKKTIKRISIYIPDAVIDGMSYNMGYYYNVKPTVMDMNGRILAQVDAYMDDLTPEAYNTFDISMRGLENTDVLVGLVVSSMDMFFPFAFEKESPARENSTYITTDFATTAVPITKPFRFLTGIEVAESIPVTGISLDETSKTLKVSEKFTITPTIDPGNASIKDVTWTSSNTDVATVDAFGVVTAKAIGSSVIRATSVDNNGVYAECNVTVEAGISVTSIVLDKETTTIAIDANETLAYTINPVDATNKQVTWSTSNANVATVDENGMVTGIAMGTADITVTTVDGNHTDICTVTVPKLAVSSVALNKSSATLTPSQNLQLTATVLPAKATYKGVTWSTTDQTIANVDQTGKVTAIAANVSTVTIRATSVDDNTKFAECIITVISKVDVTGLTLNNSSLTLTYDPSTTSQATRTLVATIAPASATDKSVRFLSSNWTVATVSNNGIITPVGFGTTTITCTSADNPSVYATCNVTVTSIKLTSITLSRSTLPLNVGECNTIFVTAYSPANAYDKNLIWTSSDNSVATVDINGKVSAINAGSATIRATTASSSAVFKTCAVTVSQSSQVGSVSISRNYLEIPKTINYTLTSSVIALNPPQLVDQSVTWSSSDDTKVLVDANGKITGVDFGEATITATSNTDNTKSASCKVKVVNPVTSLSISPTTKKTKFQGVVQLTPTIGPANADNKDLFWSTSNSTIAIIDQMGRVIGNNEGSTTITVVSKSDESVNASAQIIVDNTPPKITLNGNSTISLLYGSTYVEEGYSAFDAVDGNITSRVNITGTINSTQAGQQQLEYTVSDEAGNSSTVKRTVNVYLNLVSSITISSANNVTSIMVKGGTLHLTANILPANASIKDVDWSIKSGAEFASISTSGLVTALKTGSVVVKATSKDGSNISSEFSLSINFDDEKPVITLTGDSEIQLLKGSSFVEPGFVASDNRDGDITNRVVVTGAVDVNTLGEYIIKYNVVDLAGNAAVEKTRKVNVYFNYVTSLTITGANNANTITIKAGTLQLTANVLPVNANIKDVIWSISSGSAYASISSGGLVTAIADGVVVVKAMTKDGSNIFAEFTITISNQSTGITESEYANAKLFPNPAKTYFTIKTTLTVKRVVLYNCFGQVIFDENENESDLRFDISSFAKGIYLAQIIDSNNKVVLKKLVIE